MSVAKRNNSMRRWLKFLLVGAGLYGLFSVLAGIVIAEASLKLGHRPLRQRQQAAEVARKRYGAELQEVSINASDSVVLKGWYVRPELCSQWQTARSLRLRALTRE